MRSARRSTTSGARGSSPTRRKRWSRPAPHNARAGSNARTHASRTWSANSRSSSKKARRCSGERPYAKVAARNADLLARIRALKADHPFWGYRRIRAHLRYVDGLVVNPKRVYGVMKAADLLVKPNLKLRARRKPDTRKPKPDRPNQWWGIDMTKVMIDGFGWVYLVVVLDWHTKKVVGYYAGLQARAWHWLVALNRAVNRQFPDGIEGRSLNLMADNGCQPTARASAALGIRQAFTSDNNPKGNADTERFLRTLKEELVWLREWTSPATFFDALERWIADYNADYLHSTLGYRSPEAFEAEHLSHAPPLPAAR